MQRKNEDWSSKINFVATKSTLQLQNQLCRARQNQFRGDKINSHQRQNQLCSDKINSAATNPLLPFVATNIYRRRRGDLKIRALLFTQSQFLYPPTFLPIFATPQSKTVAAKEHRTFAIAQLCLQQQNVYFGPAAADFFFRYDFGVVSTTASDRQFFFSFSAFTFFGLSVSVGVRDT